MQKAEPQSANVQRQPAAKQKVAVESSQTEEVSQLEAMIESSPQAGKLNNLAAMMNGGSAMTAQRKLTDMMNNSPRQQAVQKLADGINSSPVMVAQRKKTDILFATAQRVREEEPLQGKFATESPAQLEPQTKPNNTGLPDNLKSGIENLSGMSMDNVKVHYNSTQPAQLNALAYAQGADIHVAPGQEQHLPHEAWHVVQQAQGRVQPTMQMKDGVGANDDLGMEREADLMGGKALGVGGEVTQRVNGDGLSQNGGEVAGRWHSAIQPVVQRASSFEFKTRTLTYDDASGILPLKTNLVGYEATALIDPSNMVAGSTTPPSNGVYQDMGLIQGHLINAQVGGPGLAENFFPITASMNAQHKNNIELPLKHKVVELGQLQAGGTPWTNRRLKYTVQVNPATWNPFTAADESQTAFNCAFAYVNQYGAELATLPRGNIIASDSLHLLHTNLDQQLTAMGGGAAGAPTGPGWGRYYTTGPAVAVVGMPGVTRKPLFLNGAQIGEIEDH